MPEIRLTTRWTGTNGSKVMLPNLWQDVRIPDTHGNMRMISLTAMKTLTALVGKEPSMDTIQWWYANVCDLFLWEKLSDKLTTLKNQSSTDVFLKWLPLLLATYTSKIGRPAHKIIDVTNKWNILRHFIYRLVFEDMYTLCILLQRCKFKLLFKIQITFDDQFVLSF